MRAPGRASSPCRSSSSAGLAASRRASLQVRRGMLCLKGRRVPMPASRRRRESRPRAAAAALKGGAAGSGGVECQRQPAVRPAAPLPLRHGCYPRGPLHQRFRHRLRSRLRSRHHYRRRRNSSSNSRRRQAGARATPMSSTWFHRPRRCIPRSPRFPTRRALPRGSGRCLRRSYPFPRQLEFVQGLAETTNLNRRIRRRSGT
mmetsp:Transcript_119289/g.345035  ORF Transcript_119289/g.345035 Transcript_119289/m.345035 type:complete len:202 (+) Transcript_119289:339-944(+)